jgi:ATP-dependent RNA helicase DeaD
MALPSERVRISRLSHNIERTLGSKINWIKVPSVSSVTKALENRILNAILGTLPDSDTVTAAPEAPETGYDTMTEAAVQTQTTTPESVLPTLPQTRLGRKLVKKLGAETAVEALIAMAFGEKLDPSRYGAITELNEVPQREMEGKQRIGKGGKRFAPAGYPEGSFEKSRFHGGGPRRNVPGPVMRGRHGAPWRGDRDEGPGAGNGARVYVGLGRRHGATARDVAGLLMRAGGVPGRLVDSIEVKDYCAFATLPEDAARRAYAFSRNTPADPAIKPASPDTYNEASPDSSGAPRRARRKKQ